MNTADASRRPDRICLIVNPRSAGGRTAEKWGHLATILRSQLGPFEVRFTEGPGDGGRKARQAAEEGFTLLLALGGDGTLGEVVDGLLGLPAQARTGVEVGLLPAGTGGDFRRTLGTSKRLADAALSLRRGRSGDLDVGRVTFRDHDGTEVVRHFVNVAGFGIAGVVDAVVNRSEKRLPGKLAFLWATMEAQRSYRNQLVRLRLDGGPWHEETIHNVAVANGRYFGGGMKIAPDAIIDDGQLDVVVLGDFGRTEVILQGFRIYTGTHLGLAKVRHTKATRIEAEPAKPDERVLLDVDGENAGMLPATFEVVPGALRMRRPAA